MADQITPLAFPEAYDDEQRAAIDVALAAVAAHDASGDTFCERTTGSPIVQRGSQLFCVVHELAYEMLCARIEADGDVWEYLPVWTPETGCVGEWPDEGRSGILHLMRCVSQRGGAPRHVGWTTAYLMTGWIRESELNATAPEIAAATADDYNAERVRLV